MGRCDYPLANRGVLAPASGPEDGAYSASVAGPLDEYGNELIPYSWAFHADSTPPHVEETVPAMGVTDGYPDERVIAWLDEPFRETSVPASALVIRDQLGKEVPGTLMPLSRSGDGPVEMVTGIQFTPGEGVFEAPAVYTATVSSISDHCLHPIVPYTWIFTMACLLGDEPWDVTIEVASCDRQQFDLAVHGIEGASEYDWQHPEGTRVDGGAPETTVTQDTSFVMDTPFPDQVATVRVRGRDQGRIHDGRNCVAAWSEPTEVSWEVCYPGPPVVTGVAPADGSDGVGIQPSLVVTYNEAVYIGAPGDERDSLEAPQVSLSLPPSGPELTFRTDWWRYRRRALPLFDRSPVPPQLTA